MRRYNLGNWVHLVRMQENFSSYTAGSPLYSDFRSRFPVVGRGGFTWDQVMDPEPEAYLGCMVDKMPNCFLFFGPNAAPGAGNAYLCAELECAHAIKCAQKLLREKIKSICVKCVTRTWPLKFLLTLF